jgi:hypothetical protein
VRGLDMIKILNVALTFGIGVFDCCVGVQVHTWF